MCNELPFLQSWIFIPVHIQTSKHNIEDLTIIVQADMGASIKDLRRTQLSMAVIKSRNQAQSLVIWHEN